MVKIISPNPSSIRRPELETPRVPESRYIPDARLTFIRGAQTWTFDGGQIFVNSHNVNELIAHDRTGAMSLMGIAEGLVEYRKKVLSADREVRDYSRFHAIIEALVTKCMEKLQQTYNQQIFGLKWKLEKGDFLINGIKIRAFMELYRLRPTRRAQKFLKGLRQKLSSFQSGQQGHKNYEKLKDLIDDTVSEIDQILLLPTIDGPEPLLSAGDPHRGSD